MGKNLKWATRLMLKLADITDANIKSIQTDKGVLFLVDADDPDVDGEVFIEDEEGIRTMPEDGYYEYENYRLHIVNGVIAEKADKNIENQTQENMNETGKEGKIAKLKLEADLPEVVNTVNDIIGALDALEDKIDGLGADTSDVPTVEELKAIRTVQDEIKAEVKEALSAIGPVLEKTVEKLSDLGNQSNGSFQDPRPNAGANAAKERTTGKDVVEYFKKK